MGFTAWVSWRKLLFKVWSSATALPQQEQSNSIKWTSRLKLSSFFILPDIWFFLYQTITIGPHCLPYSIINYIAYTFVWKAKCRMYCKSNILASLYVLCMSHVLCRHNNFNHINWTGSSLWSAVCETLISLNKCLTLHFHTFQNDVHLAGRSSGP